MPPSNPPNVSRLLETPAAEPAFASAHFAAKLALETDASDLHEDLRSGVAGIVVVDARSPEGYATAHIPGAINLPHRKITSETAAQLPKHRVIVAYCAGVHCNASTKAAAKLAALGYPVKELVDGLEGWRKEGYPIEAGTPAPLLKSLFGR
ncbi:MAG TPA: rhodanese-like domain-containing protein [Candidatus Thermoplasmatota archaeon]|nr:rhodanese-like domain-containing protein [Candidatus Thermoplasmatota archaeon]